MRFISGFKIWLKTTIVLQQPIIELLRGLVHFLVCNGLQKSTNSNGGGKEK
jgi:hypothetical protein